MSVYLSNAFSLQMQGENFCFTRPITAETAISMVTGLVPGMYIDQESEKDGSDAIYKLTAISVVGHPDIAAVISGVIGFCVPVNRVSITLKPGDLLVVGQYVGPRLPEGCKTLPEGAKVEWYAVECTKKNIMEVYMDVKELFHPETESGCALFDVPSVENFRKVHFPGFCNPE